MTRELKLLTVLCVTVVTSHVSQIQAARVVCYWDGRSFWREGVGNVTADDMIVAVQYCTHLIYGYAGIDGDDYVVKHLDKNLVLDSGMGQYRAATGLKRFNSKLKVLLSIGGFGDTDNLEKYLLILESLKSRTTFIESVRAELKKFDFDGVDLVWRFPEFEENKDKTDGLGWHGMSKLVGNGVDEKWVEHRKDFLNLIQELEVALYKDGKLLSLGVLPHVVAMAYYDITSLCRQVDMVNLWTFDFRTPKRVKLQADHSAPLHFTFERMHQQNADARVRFWMDRGCDVSKINLGIPTFGRSWKLKPNQVSGVPPVLAIGEGDKGTYSKIKGTLAYYEICNLLYTPINMPSKTPDMLLRRITDPDKRLGTYAFRLPQHDKGEKEGLWLSYEEPETAAYKSAYAKTKGLGGVVIVDLSLDDAKGVCGGSKFPILRSAKSNL